MANAKRRRRLGTALFAAFPPEWSNPSIGKGDKGSLSPVCLIALLQVLPTLPKRFAGVALSLFSKSLLCSDGMVASCLKPILPNLVRVSLKLIVQARKQLPELRGNGKFRRLFLNVPLEAQDRTLNVFKRIIVVHVHGSGERPKLRQAEAMVFDC
jgi:hypothetical protein